MFGQKSTRQIDLHLPTGWNRCTTEELEAIAAAIIQEQQHVDRYHPFDWSRVKLNTVLSINEITVSEKGTVNSEKFATATENSDTEWLVRRPQDKEPWPITTGQLVALTERLAWIDDEKASKVIFQFPYPELTLDVSGKTADHSDGGKESGSKLFTLHSSLFTLQGPPPLLDGYTWQEYRWMTDWMQEYMRHSNAIAQGNSEKRIVNNLLPQQMQARNEFLAVLFKIKEDNQNNRDNSSAEANSSLFTLHSSLFTLHSSLFEGFSPIKWQVILFWWSSLMSMLAKKFPKVFKSQPVGKGKRRPQQQDTPWDFYNRVTATIQKYIGGLSEQDVNNATYGTILQQLEMMADEAAEMEKLKRKK